jgi:hypothetical protein
LTFVLASGLWVAAFLAIIPGCATERVLPPINPMLTRSMESVVLLGVPEQHGGSAFVISSERAAPLDQITPANKWRTLVLTAGHCLDLNVFEGFDWRGQSLGMAQARWKHRQADLGIVEFWTDHQMPAVSMRPEAPRAGEHVWLVGFPWVQPVAITQGYIGDPRPRDLGDISQDPSDPLVEAAIVRIAVFGNPGNSGSPVFDDNGEVIGVLTLGFGAPGGLNGVVAVAAPVAHDWIEKVLHLDPPYWLLPKK